MQSAVAKHKPPRPTARRQLPGTATDPVIDAPKLSIHRRPTRVYCMPLAYAQRTVSPANDGASNAVCRRPILVGSRKENDCRKGTSLSAYCFTRSHFHTTVVPIIL
uniref:Uncharacterized protein n=1 Tax=Plectus sambesii TaxID=2011161 RepID=A0A914VZG3_9BILA